MKYLDVLFALVLHCIGSPVTQQDTVQQVPPSQSLRNWYIEATLAHAIDITAERFRSTSDFTCFRQYHYNVAFIRGYNPSGSGTVEPYAVNNTVTADYVGLGVEVYMAPQPNTVKSGAQQR
ncbi:hypothetical protein GCK32_010929 [Trichostrongylus colubriformis]|uniref:Uncharacterized protein n=1 Tax=Trichostrongylus colubriformis TaxID=6319 RepID=A0AAN8ITE6_TRICO